MKHSFSQKSLMLAASVAGILAFAGCGKQDAASSTGSGEAARGSEVPAKISGQAAEARDAVLAEVAKHCRKGPDGWYTVTVGGSQYAPEHFYRHFRELDVERVASANLSEADRLNGFEWSGEVVFKRTVCREMGEPGVSAVLGVRRQRDQWTQWVDFQPTPVPVFKVHGKWQIQPKIGLLSGDALLTGVLPPPTIFSQAGAK
jgi:hypothetical protein